MASKKNWLEIMVILLVFGVMVIGCDKTNNNIGDEQISMPSLLTGDGELINGEQVSVSSLLTGDGELINDSNDEQVSGLSLLLAKDGGLYLEIHFYGKPWSSMYITDAFAATINGDTVDINKGYVFDGNILVFFLDGNELYTAGQDYTVKIVYVKDPALELFYDPDAEILLESFTIEKEVNLNLY